MAITITPDGDNFSVLYGNRVVVRTSAGIPYVIVFNDSDNRIEAFKGNATTPTQFDEQDVNGTGNGPASALYVGASAAIDENDVIHIAYADRATEMAGGGLRYVQFDTNDNTFKNDALAQAWPDSPPGSAIAHTAIAIDSSGRVHIAFSGSQSNMGTDYRTIYYTNDVATPASFKTPVEVEGYSAEQLCIFPNITIDADDLPCVSYVNSTGNNAGTAQGDVNNASSFTLFDIASSSGYFPIAVDSSGNHYVVYVEMSTGDLEIRKHNYGDDWDTEAGGLGWQAAEIVDDISSTGNAFAGQPTLSLVINGTDRYIFAEETVSSDIEYWYDTGGGWTAGGALEGNGALNTVRAKWAFWVDYNSEGASWYNPSWPYRVKVTIDKDKVDGDLTDYPIYVNLNDLPSGFHTNVNQTDARDIRVTKADGVTELPREVVFYTAASDTGELHLKYTGTLSSTVDTDIYIYYGNASASDYAVDATYGAENVWDSNYKAVYHMQTADPVDSTSNDNDTTDVGTVSPVTGAIGKALEYEEANSEYSYKADNASLDITDELTITAIFNLASLPATDQEYHIVGKDNSTTRGYWFEVLNADFYGRTALRFGVNNGVWIKGYDTAFGDTALAIDTTYYVSGYFDPDGSPRMALYNLVTLDDSQATSSASIGNTNAALRLGAREYSGAENYFDGWIDEVRISDIKRPVVYLTTQARNLSSPSTFYSVGSQGTPPASTEIDYVFTDESGSPDILFGSLNIGPVEYTQTIQAKANIGTGVQQYTQTVEVKADIQRTTSQTIETKASIKKQFTQTVDSKARIQILQQQTITALARIEKQATQSISAKASIQKTQTQTVTSLARIQIITTQSIEAKGRIQILTTQTIQSLARIATTTTRTITATASIKVSQTQSVNAKANIAFSYTQTIEAKARIEVTQSKTITAKARIEKTFTQTLTARGRIEGAVSQTIETKADILTSQTQSVETKARIGKAVEQTVTASARITISTTQTLTALARITIQTTRNVDAKARILGAVGQSIDAKANIRATIERTISALADIQQAFTQTINAKANILIIQTYTQTIDAKARITIGTTQTIQAKARIGISLPRIIEAKANIKGVITKTIWAKGDIKATMDSGQSYNLSRYWSVRYEADALPQNSTPAWTSTDGHNESVSDGILTIDGPWGGYYELLDAGISKSTGFTIETRLKIVTADSPDGYSCLFGVELGSGEPLAYVGFTEDKVMLTEEEVVSPVEYAMDTTDDFHVYRLTVKDLICKVYIDGVLRLTATLNNDYGTDTLAIFGMYDDPFEHQWDYVYFRTDGAFSPLGAVAKASIKKTTSQSVTSKGRIGTLGTQTIETKGRIQKQSSQTISTKGRIKTLFEQTIEAKANIQATISKTIEAKARIKQVFTQTIDSKARIQTISTQSVDAKANIVSTQTKTINAKGRIEIFGTKTINAKASIKKTPTQTIQAKANITSITITQTVDTKANIVIWGDWSEIWSFTVVVETTQTIEAKANIASPITIQTVEARARIQIISTQTLTALARITITSTQSLITKGNIKRFGQQTIEAKAKIQATQTQTIEAKGAIRRITEQTVSALARIGIISTQTVNAKAQIIGIIPRTISAKASIATAIRWSIQAKASISKTITQTTQAKASIIRLFVQTISAKGFISTWRVVEIIDRVRDQKLVNEITYVKSKMKEIN